MLDLVVRRGALGVLLLMGACRPAPAPAPDRQGNLASPGGNVAVVEEAPRPAPRATGIAQDPEARRAEGRIDRIDAGRWREDAPVRLVGSALGLGDQARGRQVAEAAPGGVAALRRLADLGHMRAQEILGMMLRSETFGLPANPSEALRYFERAIAAGSPDAPRRAAQLFGIPGHGVRHDIAEEARFLAIGADRGDSHAMLKLGEFLYHGCGGLPVDRARAVGLYRRASAAGNSGADYQLGLLYLEGAGGVPRNDEEARRLLERSDLPGSRSRYSSYESATVARRQGRIPASQIRAPMWCHGGG